MAVACGAAGAASDTTGFLRRQVLTSRNVRGGLLTDFALGGLNYQIEHHLFPSMPRPSLRRSQALVAAFCAYRRRKNTVSTWKKSTARIVLAWVSRNLRQVLSGPSQRVPAHVEPLPRLLRDGFRSGYLNVHQLVLERSW